MNDERNGCRMTLILALVVVAEMTVACSVRTMEAEAAKEPQPIVEACVAELSTVDKPVDPVGIRHLAGVDTDLIWELPEETEPELVSLGTWKITYYCCEPYEHICGTGDGLTATGIPVTPGIVAVDPKVIPYGSTVVIDGVEYLAADCGGNIKDQRIDIAVETHQEALELGVQWKEVFIHAQEP